MNRARRQRQSVETAARARAARRAGARLADSGQRLLVPRLVLLFFAGCLLFGTPVLWPGGTAARVGGVPVLYVTLFAAWAVFIGVLGWLVESAARRSTQDAAPEARAAHDDALDAGAGDPLA